ncbi:hypothetical protein DRN97_01530 [Methanosarcinales archaeon]|nr:MAG: hypothetical protein DRN97_01530 [Methanosarcinales archaeon]
MFVMLFIHGQFGGKAKKMGVKSSAEITRILKEKWDKSKDKEDWRVLTGRNPKGRYDMFISSPERIWQLKMELTGSNEAIGFGLEVGKMDDELKKLLRIGAPVPFGLISPQKKPDLAIIMAGIQQYSSDSTYTLCKEYISEKQAKLDEKLDREIERMSSDPISRRKYKEQKERETRSYL